MICFRKLLRCCILHCVFGLNPHRIFILTNDICKVEKCRKLIPIKKIRRWLHVLLSHYVDSDSGTLPKVFKGGYLDIGLPLVRLTLTLTRHKPSLEDGRRNPIGFFTKH
ncbi:hypothetical protein L6452_04253 [Arctium lappa]|uniref:Uncharacterized protein n=1 Tax=Arctium lappa TaxID=4217 RepID=A0ACB9FPK5_ARCLA|nr:hypothetical protein L6452_04253 [Arctium lappa]